MEFQNIHGSFGSNEGRENINYESTKKRKRTKSPFTPAKSTFSIPGILAENVVDILCIVSIAVFIIAAICCWDTFSQSIFETLIFPIVYIGGKTFGAIVMAFIAVKLFFSKLFRKIFRWW